MKIDIRICYLYHELIIYWMVPMMVYGDAGGAADDGAVHRYHRGHSVGFELWAVCVPTVACGCELDRAVVGCVWVVCGLCVVIVL